MPIPLQTINEHFLYEIDGELCIIDTGAGASASEIRLFGDLARQVEQTVGVPVQRLLPFLPQGRITIGQKTVTIEENATAALPANAQVLPWKGIWNNLPLLEVTFNGQPTTAVFDTGARVHFSIGKQQYLKGCPEAGEFDDYLAAIQQNHHGKLWQVPFTCHGFSQVGNMALIPPGTGYDQCLNHFDTIVSAWQLWRDYDLCIDGQKGLALLPR